MYAAVVATASLVVATLAYRSGGSRLKIHARIVRGAPGHGWILVSATNKGRAEITIDSINLWVGHSILGLANQPLAIVSYALEKGPELPHRLRAQDLQTWAISISHLDDVLGTRRLRWRDFVRVCVSTPFGTARVRLRQDFTGSPLWQALKRLDDRIERRPTPIQDGPST
jgi:hypothetical protein